jgi:hypothetical protein
MRRTPVSSQLLIFSTKDPMIIPTARVRSVGDVHSVDLVSSLAVERAVGPAGVKETIFEVEHTNSVSMPSEVFADAGCEADRTAGRAGSVKECRAVVELRAGASSRFLDTGNMTGGSCARYRRRQSRGERVG